MDIWEYKRMAELFGVSFWEFVQMVQTQQHWLHWGRAWLYAEANKPTWSNA
ncbi:MAG: hypothetical protein HC911_17540 [Chloroflexaceae bacterium]|nr:hypothetical protein [Chloroflexaceae bacterium]